MVAVGKLRRYRKEYFVDGMFHEIVIRLELDNISISNNFRFSFQNFTFSVYFNTILTAVSRPTFPEFRRGENPCICHLSPVLKLYTHRIRVRIVLLFKQLTYTRLTMEEFTNRVQGKSSRVLRSIYYNGRS